MPAKNRVVCKVPGSTSNCGSGFDTLGLALSVYNEVLVERSESEGTLDFGKDLLPVSSMARETAGFFFSRLDLPRFEARLRIRGQVPQARGLGSSVTLRAGILAGLAELSGAAWDKDKLVEWVTELEGHPDNASASILGGFTVSRFVDTPSKVEAVTQIEVSDWLRFVVVSPDFEVLTSDSRGALPGEVGFSDVVSSINGASCLVAALASGQYRALRSAVNDRVHEPYRLEAIPGASASIGRGIAAGAYTGWLSGSGSSVLCVCEAAGVPAVMDAMRSAFSEVGCQSVGRDLCVDNEGLVIQSSV